MIGRRADVVVVGGGITGVATLRALARSGIDAVLLEQFDLGHARGSSHGTSRIFRLSYPDVTYSRLALAAREGWRELERECHERLIVQTGTLDVGEETPNVEQSLRELDIAFELPSAATAAERWGMEFEDDAQLVFQPEGGYSLADRSHAALVASARAAGGTFVENEPVVNIDQRPGGVALTTRSDGIDARAVVVAAGAWGRGLLAPLGIDLPVVATRETVAYFDLPGAEKLPPLIEYPSSVSPLPVGQAYYALPAPGRGLKAGVHHSGYDTDPDDMGTPDPAVVDATGTWLARRFPGANTAPSATETCVYTNTADESFVIEAHERIVVASACSGHGFKFAPLHGSVIAALAIEAAG